MLKLGTKIISVLLLIILTFLLSGYILKPDPILTPGVILTTNAEITRIKGYSKSVRKTTQKTKQKVFSNYGVTCNFGTYEIDHRISLILGGSDEEKNLWPQSYVTSADVKNGVYGAIQKDICEAYLYRQVKSGKMSLPEAQRIISKDWVNQYKRIKNIPITSEEGKDPD